MVKPLNILAIVPVLLVVLATAAWAGDTSPQAARGASGAPAEEPETPFPALPTGAALPLAGTTVRINGCDVLDVYDGPDGLSPVMLRWNEPSSRRVWLQGELDRAVQRYHDPWEAFVELGGGVRQSTSGFAVLAQVSDEVSDCEGFVLPVLDVLEVRGAWNLQTMNPARRAVEALSPEGLDVDDEELERILSAGRSARSGSSEPLVIEVEGVTDLSLGCPPWALVESRSVTFNCAPRRGFVDLQYASPELAPDPDRILFELLLEQGQKDIEAVRTSTAERLRERADWLARRGPYRYLGRFTGEVTLNRGTEALFLTPVFVVESVVPDETPSIHPLGDP